MTDVLAIDPLAGLSADLPQDTAREHVAAQVRADAVSVDDANKALVAHGMAPLQVGSNDYFEARRESLLQSDDFQKAMLRGDPDAVSSLYALDLKIQQTSGKLTDRAPSSSDPRYDQLRNVVYANTPGDGGIEAADRVAAIASSLHLDGENAKSMIELQYAADRETASMSAEQRETWGEWQVQSLKSALGPDADNKLEVASEVISRLRGVKTDVAATVREGGSRIGLQLISVAQVTAHRNKW